MCGWSNRDRVGENISQGQSGGEHITGTVVASSAYPGNTTLHDTDKFPCEMCRAESMYDWSNRDRVGENISQTSLSLLTRILIPRPQDDVTMVSNVPGPTTLLDATTGVLAVIQSPNISGEFRHGSVDIAYKSRQRTPGRRLDALIRTCKSRVSTPLDNVSTVLTLPASRRT
uniref:Uncharacterized protein n=1 Tax=Timema tahoe TaxID=61484 RepID=A0A7R9IFX1_9NEOP|nr:unnamed protein product [Timema tahoe]